MAGTWRTSLTALISVFIVIPSATAFDGCGGYWAPALGHSSYWPSGYSSYWPRTITVIPLGHACEAVPTAAPPSQTKEPPRAPVINSARSLGGTYNSGTTSTAKDRCQVGFWNLTGRDVTLTVAGKSLALPKNRKIMVELEREFSWQSDRGVQQVERVPENQAAHEIAVRN